MIIDGEKFACETCIRGHRATQCQHSDRPLQQVGVKGRPVSQCNHCRSLRQSRSVHTKCTCATAARKGSSSTRRCRCFEDDYCSCASSHRGCDSSAHPQKALSPDTPASSSASGQNLDQFDFNQPLPVQATASPQSQQTQPLQPSDIGSLLASTHELGELGDLDHDAMLNAWSLPEIDATLLDTAPAMDWSEMALPEFTQLPGADLPIEDSLQVGDPSTESWFLDANTWPGAHDGHDWQESHDRGSPSNMKDLDSGNLQP